MTPPPARSAARARLDRAAAHRLAAITVLGFASGLPLALTGQAMQAWLGSEGIGLATIGFLSLVGLPYTFQVPMGAADGPLRAAVARPGAAAGWWRRSSHSPARSRGWRRRRPAAPSARSPRSPARSPSCRRRRTSSSTPIAPTSSPPTSAGWALRSTSSAIGLAMIVSGGIALIWVDPAQGGGWSWPEVYRLMALLMLGAAAFSGDVAAARAARRAADQRRKARRDRLRRRHRGRRGRLRRHDASSCARP